MEAKLLSVESQRAIFLAVVTAISSLIKFDFNKPETNELDKSVGFLQSKIMP